MSKDKPLRIRNSTAEFLIFTRQAGEEGIEVRVEDETVWLTQKLMAVLFEVTVPTISEHLTNLFQQGELSAGATVRKFRIVQTEGTGEVNRIVDFYNLDVIISVGYRVKSLRGTQFRIWATQLLREYIVKGFTMDDERLKQRGRGNPRMSDINSVGGRRPRLYLNQTNTRINTVVISLLQSFNF